MSDGKVDRSGENVCHIGRSIVTANVLAQGREAALAGVASLWSGSLDISFYHFNYGFNIATRQRQALVHFVKGVEEIGKLHGVH